MKTTHGRKMFILPHLFLLWRSHFLFMISWVQKRFLMGSSLLIGSLSCHRTLATCGWILFFWKYCLTKKLYLEHAHTHTHSHTQVTGRGDLKDSCTPIQSQRENCKIVAWFLSHYYLDRRRKNSFLSIDNFPFTWNDLGPNPLTNPGFYGKTLTV